MWYYQLPIIHKFIIEVQFPAMASLVQHDLQDSAGRVLFWRIIVSTKLNQQTSAPAWSYASLTMELPMIDSMPLSNKSTLKARPRSGYGIKRASWLVQNCVSMAFTS